MEGWLAFIITILAMAMEALVSFLEGTFLRRQKKKVSMNFLSNLAISVGGFIIFPMVNAIIVPKLKGGFLLYLLGLILGLILAAIAYRAWWVEGEGNKGHVLWWEVGRSYIWTKDVTQAGWMHFLYLSVEIMLLVVYCFSPVEAMTAIMVSLCLFVLIVVANYQAAWIQGGFKRSLAIKELIALIMFTAVKLFI